MKGLLKTQPEPPNLHFVPLLPPLPSLRKTLALTSLQLPFEELQAAVGLPAQLPQPPLQHTCSSPAWMVALSSILSLPLSIRRHSFPGTASAAPTMGNKFPLLAGHAGCDLSQQECISGSSCTWHLLLPPGPLQWGCFSGSQLPAGFSTPRTELCASLCQTSWHFF